MNQHYEIHLKGHLDPAWSESLGHLTIVHQENGETLLTGVIVDQAALHGILNRLRDIGIPLISVNLVKNIQASDKTDTGDASS